MQSFKQFLTEEVNSIKSLLRDWIKSGDKFPEDPDDKSSPNETAVHAMERRIQEYSTTTEYKEYKINKHDYEIQDVPLKKILRTHQSEVDSESFEYTAKQIKHAKDYKQIRRKHDILPILLGTDFSVLDGNHRIEAAKTNGLTSIPALVPVQDGNGKVLNAQQY